MLFFFHHHDHHHKMTRKLMKIKSQGKARFKVYPSFFHLYYVTKFVVHFFIEYFTFLVQLIFIEWTSSSSTSCSSIVTFNLTFYNFSRKNNQIDWSANFNNWFQFLRKLYSWIPINYLIIQISICWCNCIRNCTL